MQNFEYDVLVLGSGPGGYVAAIKASQLGLKTAVIEKESLGGVCLNWGCIPTKALLRSAEILRYIKDAEDFGIKCNGHKVEFSKVIERSRKIANQLSGGIDHLLKKYNISVIYGHGKLANKNCINVTKKDGKIIKVTAKNIIIATGSKPKFLNGLSPEDSDLIMGYKQALLTEKMPKKMLIIGSGAIGVEFASFYHTLGCQVTILEVLDRIIANEDKEVSEFVQKSFERQGVRIFTSAKINKFFIYKDKIDFEIKSKDKVMKESFDSVISAVGISPNVENIGIENTNIKISDKKYILTNKLLETDEAGIFAIGDVVAPPWLAHKASREGVICAEVIAGKKTEPINKLSIPGCIYCHPQVASVGLTQCKAEEEYGKDDVSVGNFPLLANGKALAFGDTEGFVKTIFRKKTGELLGTHMVGPEVTELIFGLSLAKQLESTEIDLMKTIFPHPTISEAVHESVLNAFSKGIHI
jgi:dihydrolipoamide dehydrogenase